MMVGDFGGIGRVSCKAGLEAELDPGGGPGVFLETQVLLKDPEEVSRKAAPGQKACPGDQSVFEGRALITASVFHNLH
jgi:hypothetical protein